MTQQNLLGEHKTTCDIICIIDKGACPDYKVCEERKNIENKIRGKYDRAFKKAKEEFNIDPPKIEDINRIVYTSWNSGFKCPYCGIKLSFHTTRGVDEIKPAASLDHKIPLSSKGTNKIDNLQLICHRCNIVKIHLHPDYYNTVVNCIRNLYGIGGLVSFLDTLYYPLVYRQMDEQKIRELNKKILSLEAKSTEKPGDAIV